MSDFVTPQEAAKGMLDSIKRVAAEEGVPEGAVAVLAAAILGAQVDPDHLKWAADEIARARVPGAIESTVTNNHGKSE